MLTNETISEMVRIIREKDRMCNTYECADFPLHDIDICDVRYVEDPEESVRIVEEWAKEQESEKTEQEQKKPDQPEESIDLHAIIDELEYRIDKLEKKVSNEALIFREVSKRNQKTHRELADRIATLEKYPVESINEPKRTNKDVLLATFPRMVMDGDVPVLCPRTMDRDIHIQYCAGRSCYQCRCEYWLSEAEE